MLVNVSPAGPLDHIIRDRGQRNQQHEIDRAIEETVREIDVELAPGRPRDARQPPTMGKGLLGKDLHEVNGIGDIAQILQHPMIAHPVQNPIVHSKIIHQRGEQNNHQRNVDGKMQRGDHQQRDQQPMLRHCRKQPAHLPGDITGKSASR